MDRFIRKLEGSGSRTNEHPRIQKRMNVCVDSLYVAADAPRNLSQSERPGAGHRLQYRPATGSENSLHKCVRGKSQSWPALGAPSKRACESLLDLHLGPAPDCHRSHGHSFTKATSAQKSARSLSRDVNWYCRSRLPAYRWSPLPAALSYRTTQVPRITYVDRYSKRCSQPSNGRSNRHTTGSTKAASSRVRRSSSSGVARAL
jgi:hypothetical protein